MSDHKQQSTNEAAWLSIVKQHVRSLHFGVVQIVVHDDRVVQIERTEKVRLNDVVGNNPRLNPTTI